MKFICKTEPFRHFRGHLFKYYMPTEITDKATIEALMRHPEFVLAEDKAEEASPIPDVCPKCGKTVKRGKVMHQKYCKGK